MMVAWYLALDDKKKRMKMVAWLLAWEDGSMILAWEDGNMIFDMERW